jgi:hypothetical protein
MPLLCVAEEGWSVLWVRWNFTPNFVFHDAVSDYLVCVWVDYHPVTTIIRGVRVFERTI